MNWRYFPSNHKPNQNIHDLINAFKSEFNNIDSKKYNYKSNEVLLKLAPRLISLGYAVESGKRKADKIRIPVLFGENGQENLAFEADAYSENNKIVVEVEAGRALTNHQFLKDFFQACMMNNVEYLCIAVRLEYKKKKDYKKICEFFEAMYASNRLIVPLKGILIIGY